MVFVALCPSVNFCVGNIKHIEATENELDLECISNTMGFILYLVPVPDAQILHSDCDQFQFFYQIHHFHNPNNTPGFPGVSLFSNFSWVLHSKRMYVV